MTLGCQFLSPLAEDIERLVLLYWYLPIHQPYLTFDKLDTGLSWDIAGVSKYHQKMPRDENGIKTLHIQHTLSNNSNNNNNNNNNNEFRKSVLTKTDLVWKSLISK